MSGKEKVGAAGFGLDFDSMDEMDEECARLGLKPGAPPSNLRPGQATPDQRRLTEEDLRKANADATRVN